MGGQDDLGAVMQSQFPTNHDGSSTVTLVSFCQQHWSHWAWESQRRFMKNAIVSLRVQWQQYNTLRR
jgi:hypothetical protein